MANPPTAGSPSLLRRLNSAALLHAVRSDGPISRSELARVTGLSKPTVKEVVELLLASGYITESMADQDSGPRRPGPRARLLSFRSDLGHVVGIDIGANKVLALVTDLSGAVIASERRRTGERERHDAEALLDLVSEVATAALERAEVPLDEVRAVGVGTPGVVDPATGCVKLAPQLGGWDGIQLDHRLEQVLPGPVLVDNEVRLSLLAERWRGAARDIDTALFVQIGVGIGGGVLIGGDVYRGASGAAGEIGYLPLFDEVDVADRLGPFEHAAGGTAFARLARRTVESGEGATMLELSDGDLDAIDAEVVFAAAERGDAAGRRILEEILERLAWGIAAAIIVLDPSTVIVGGGISRAGPSLLEPLEQRVRSLVPVAPQIVLSILGDESVALGAVRLALQTVEERLFELSASGVA